jgi:hypothetical protein
MRHLALSVSCTEVTNRMLHAKVSWPCLLLWIVKWWSEFGVGVWVCALSIGALWNRQQSSKELLDDEHNGPFE